MALDTTKYLKGSGISADPFIIHDVAAWREFITNGYCTNYFFELVSSIDCASINGFKYVSSQYCFSAYLNCNGYKIYNVDPCYVFYYGSYIGEYMDTPGKTYAWFGYITGEILNGHFVLNRNSNAIKGFFTSNKVSTGKIANCIFEFSGGCSNIKWCAIGTENSAVINNVFFSFPTATDLSSLSGVGTSATNCHAYSSLGWVTTWAGCTLFTSVSAAGNPNNYVNHDVALWCLDGMSLPRLYPQNVSHLTAAFVVKGVTKVNGKPKSRRCIASSPLDLSFVAAAVSDSVTGEYVINCGMYSDHVFVSHSDSYGYKFVASKSYVLGEIMHPSIPNGYCYECTAGGTSASEPPLTWPSSGVLTSGTAMFTPKPIYKPEVFLVAPIKIDLITGNPT